MQIAWVQAARRLVLDSVLAEVVGKLEGEGVQPLLIKGPVFARWLYDDPRQRPYADIDLVVDPNWLPRAGRVLSESGFEPHRNGSHAHEHESHHEQWWRSTGLPALVELHPTLPLVPADPSSVWRRLNQDTRTIEVAGATVRIPGEAACALIVGLHAAHHGSGVQRPLQDLGQALDRLGLEIWRAAAALADELGTGAAFAVGLGLRPEGRALAQRLALPGQEASRLVRLHASSAPLTAIGLERLIEQMRGAGTGRARVRLLAQKLAPSAERMRSGYPLARRGQRGLLAAYVVRPFVISQRLSPALRAWLSAARPARRASRGSR